jgi:hypothetical protein
LTNVIDKVVEIHTSAMGMRSGALNIVVSSAVPGSLYEDAAGGHFFVGMRSHY